MKGLAKIACAVLVVALQVDWVHALTAEQIIRLKKAGVSEETIRIMLEQEKETRDHNSCDRFGVSEIKDAQGNATIIYSTGAASTPARGDSEQEKVEKAWKMLQTSIIDARQK